MTNASSGLILRIAIQFLLAVRRRGDGGSAAPHLKPGDIAPTPARWEYRPDGSRVLVMPELTIYGGTGPSQAGKPFPSADQAASAALKEIYGPSMDTGYEWAGNIYRNSDGTYSFSPPVTSKSTDESYPGQSPVPTGREIIGTYHSHGGGSLDGFETDELFSPDDKLKATLSKDPMYLLTPQGNLFRYTPADLLSPADQARFPYGRVTRLH
jgi:hypothetical protein